MRLNQATLPVSDLAASVRFYQRLGLKQIVDSPHYARFEVGDGSATLSVELVQPGQVPGNGAQLYFECEDLDGRVADLMAAGVAFEHAPRDQSWLWREAWLTDPDGHRLCFYHAGDMRRFPPWRLQEA